MADTMRWRYGETNPIVLPVDSATEIEIGDLVWLDTDDAKPASDVSDQLSEAANQEYFHDRFAGVAMQRSGSGDTDAIRVATTGVFEFACASGTFEVGDLIGATEAAGGTELEDQTTVAVGSGNENRAIGRCTRRVASADTRVLVDVVSTVMRGGPQAAA
ncbi:MAG: DUF2190 family protein [Pirellulales bacterium]|nr:hypothetical protein [Planctomycetales bacterium]